MGMTRQISHAEAYGLDCAEEAPMPITSAPKPATQAKMTRQISPPVELANQATMTRQISHAEAYGLDCAEEAPMPITSAPKPATQAKMTRQISPPVELANQ